MANFASVSNSFLHPLASFGAGITVFTGSYSNWEQVCQDYRFSKQYYFGTVLPQLFLLLTVKLLLVLLRAVKQGLLAVQSKLTTSYNFYNYCCNNCHHSPTCEPLTTIAPPGNYTFTVPESLRVQETISVATTILIKKKKVFRLSGNDMWLLLDPNELKRNLTPYLSIRYKRCNH